jgi:hypothetical protein
MKSSVHCKWAHVAAVLVAVATSLGTASAAGARLKGDGRGGLLLDGRPFFGAGVNVYDLFVRTLDDPGRTNAVEVLAGLARAGIPFVRFSASGYWPANWGLYRTNKSEFFERWDNVVRAAENAGVGLIPSLFWNPPTVGDLAGDPFGAWGESDSGTWKIARAYIADLVGRSRLSPAIWAWEFGNEFNLPADLPNAADHRPPVVPALGTAASRGPADDLSHDQFRTALRLFGEEVRKLDPDRLILSGNAFPRPTAWHQWKEKSWTRDTPAQAEDMLRDDNPDPVGMLSVRLYSPEDASRIVTAAEQGRRIGKPLFVGEFGVPGQADAGTVEKFKAMLGLLEKARTPLVALWVYDYDGQASDWNVTPSNARRALWETYVEWNRRRSK